MKPTGRKIEYLLMTLAFDEQMPCFATNAILAQERGNIT